MSRRSRSVAIPKTLVRSVAFKSALEAEMVHKSVCWVIALRQLMARVVLDREPGYSVVSLLCSDDISSNSWTALNKVMVNGQSVVVEQAYAEYLVNQFMSRGGRDYWLDLPLIRPFPAMQGE